MLFNIKEKKISFRLSLNDYELLSRVADRCGMTISQYLRMILDCTIVNSGISIYENK